MRIPNRQHVPRSKVIVLSEKLDAQEAYIRTYRLSLRQSKLEPEKGTPAEGESEAESALKFFPRIEAEELSRLMTEAREFSQMFFQED